MKNLLSEQNKEISRLSWTLSWSYFIVPVKAPRLNLHFPKRGSLPRWVKRIPAPPLSTILCLAFVGNQYDYSTKQCIGLRYRRNISLPKLKMVAKNRTLKRKSYDRPYVSCASFQLSLDQLSQNAIRQRSGHEVEDLIPKSREKLKLKILFHLTEL